MKRTGFTAASLSVLLLILFAATTPVYCEEEVPAVASFNLQAYAPARVVISYAYTNNFSVTDVSSLGKSLYKIVSSPTSIEFRAEDVDTYTFTVEIKYAVITSQSLQIAVFSSSHAPEGFQFNVKDDYVRIKFTLTVTEEPRYPSAQDVAEQVVRQVADQLAEFRTQTEETLHLQNRNIETQWILVGFNMAVSAALLIFIVHWVWPMLKRLRAEVEFGGE